jgi:hypothetical protein
MTPEERALLLAVAASAARPWPATGPDRELLKSVSSDTAMTAFDLLMPLIRAVVAQET